MALRSTLSCLEGDQTKIFTSTRCFRQIQRRSQMDLESLTRLFATTLSPDPNVRKAGELQIKKVGRRLNIYKVDRLDQCPSYPCFPTANLITDVISVPEDPTRLTERIKHLQLTAPLSQSGYRLYRDANVLCPDAEH